MNGTRLDPHGPPPGRYPDGSLAPRYPDGALAPVAPAAEPAPEPPWWQHEWAIVAAGLLGLIVGLGVGLLAGDSGTTQTVAHEGGGRTATRTVTRTVPRTKVLVAPRVLVRTQTVTVTTPPAASSGRQAGESGGLYSGTGNRDLGTLTVQRDSTLRWTCAGTCEPFSISNDPGDPAAIELPTQGHSGAARIAAGVYHHVTVSTGGRWSIRIE